VLTTGTIFSTDDALRNGTGNTENQTRRYTIVKKRVYALKRDARVMRVESSMSETKQIYLKPLQWQRVRDNEAIRNSSSRDISQDRIPSKNPELKTSNLF
jgi:hypothetical protein